MLVLKMARVTRSWIPFKMAVAAPILGNYLHHVLGDFIPDNAGSGVAV